MNAIVRNIKDNGLLPEGAAILDITASGRYWRTALIEEVSVILRRDGRLTEKIWSCSSEEDDYAVLTELTEALAGTQGIITFNGHSFDLPFLRHKYEAYGLPDPLTQKEFMDLFLLYKPLKRICAIPSEKLADYYEFAKTDAKSLVETDAESLLKTDAESLLEKGGKKVPPVTGGLLKEEGLSPHVVTDALKTLAILSLRAYLDAFDGKIAVRGCRLEDDHLYLEMKLAFPCPRDLSLHDTIYHARFSGSVLTIGMPVEHGTIRIYHTDLQNYVYLPNEGYAVHKSVAQFVERSRRERPTRENCFHRAVVSEQTLKNEEWVRKLSESVLAYMRSR